MRFSMLRDFDKVGRYSGTVYHSIGDCPHGGVDLALHMAPT